MPDSPPSPTTLPQLIDDTVRHLKGVRFGVLASGDGLLITASTSVDRTAGDQLAAVASGMSGLARGAARLVDGTVVEQAVVEYDSGALVLMTLRDGSIFAFGTDATADIGTVGYTMALLAKKTDTLLTPQLAASLRHALPVDGPTRQVMV
ncbi:roadblock/LC7 domain-containing protein [Cellulomonas taurus]|uniref:roadblock/LC7 domain-containing protein n=1 Tax=Cellulomonas taurus TaxID=2729175 RepID=UPI00145FB90F|nr:roadblock/LC7 domain-containing protein [Cellulomonas taurus]